MPSAQLPTMRATAHRWMLYLCGAILLALCLWWPRHITEHQIESDAAANLQMSLNLAHHGIISLDSVAPFKPTNYREPVPVVVSAVAVGLLDAALGKSPRAEAYFSGERARFVKLQNIFWMLLLMGGIYYACILFTGSRLIGLAGALAVNFRLPASPTGLLSLGFDDLLSDFPAAALLVWGSALLAKGLQESRWSPMVAAGLTFGMLALTKAAFLYVFAGVMVYLSVDFAIRSRGRQDRSKSAVHLVLLALAFAVVVTPWMTRNYVYLDSFGIAGRGGGVLYLRAAKDQMTAEEYRGSFYVWAPPKLRPLVGAVLGYSKADLQRNGRLQRIYREPDSDFHTDDIAAEAAGRPDQAITYYHKARAKRVALERKLADSPSPSVAVDEAMKEEALSIIRANPLKHLAMTIPFLWRGAFTVFPILLIALSCALLTRRFEMSSFVVPAFGVVMFYGIFTHYTPRYSVPAVGVTIVAALVLVLHAWASIRVRRRSAAVLQ